MTKAERLQTFTSVSTHAMVIVGAHVDEKTGKPVRYRVENSWSADAGTKGKTVTRPFLEEGLTVIRRVLCHDK